MNPKGSAQVGVINDTTDFFTTPPGETLLKPTKATKPAKRNQAYGELAYGAKHGGHDFKALNQIYDIWSKNIK